MLDYLTVKISEYTFTAVARARRFQWHYDTSKWSMAVQLTRSHLHGYLFNRANVQYIKTHETPDFSSRNGSGYIYTRRRLDQVGLRIADIPCGIFLDTA